MKIELVNREKWRTKIELSIAMADYIVHFYNEKSRHSSIDYLTAIEFEDLHSTQTQTQLSLAWAGKKDLGHLAPPTVSTFTR